MTSFAYAKPQSDIFYVYVARALRGFGDGFAVIILPVYLLAIGLSPNRSESSQAPHCLERPRLPCWSGSSLPATISDACF